MGFYYLLLMLIGVVLIMAGALNKGVSRSVKKVIFLIVMGVFCIVSSVLLLMPGSSDIIADLLK